MARFAKNQVYYVKKLKHDKICCPEKFGYIDFEGREVITHTILLKIVRKK